MTLIQPARNAGWIASSRRAAVPCLVRAAGPQQARRQHRVADREARRRLDRARRGLRGLRVAAAEELGEGDRDLGVVAQWVQRVQADRARGMVEGRGVVAHEAVDDRRTPQPRAELGLMASARPSALEAVA